MSESSRPPRRIVTGHDPAGRGVVVSDAPAPASRAIADGATFHDMWVTSASPAPVAATEPEPIGEGELLGPPDEGTRVRSVDSIRGSLRPTALANPQSTTSVSPCLPTITFDGLRSRWITPRLCA